MLNSNVVRERFAAYYHASSEVIACAPGRVNLLGEHTDYNDGFVLPIAIDRSTCVAARARADRIVHCYTVQFDQADSFSLDAIERSATLPWSNYVRGVIHGIQTLYPQVPLGGADLLIDSDIPLGSGLSSSAALEIAVGAAFQALNHLRITGTALALLAQQAEHIFAGVQCGMMDQLIVALGQADHALLIDCRDQHYKPVPLPSQASIIVSDSGVERTLAASAYNQRRAECAEAVRYLQAQRPAITALRDVTVADLDQYGTTLPPLIRARARHVVHENARTLAGAAALQADDLATFGALMCASHISLRDDYQVSSDVLDTLVAAAWAVPGCYGSRLTGAGFGGCTVSLVQTAAIERFVTTVTQAYQSRTGRIPAMYVCRAAAGVQIIV